MNLQPYKKLPFSLADGKLGGACSLATFANIFNNGSWTDAAYVSSVNNREMKGLLFSEEVLKCYIREGLHLEPAVLTQEWIPYSYLNSIITDQPQKDEAYVYLLRSRRENNKDKTNLVGHRFAILVTDESLYLIDSYYTHSYKVDEYWLKSNEKNIISIFSAEATIVGLDILFTKERQIKVFTKSELSHLL